MPTKAKTKRAPKLRPTGLRADGSRVAYVVLVGSSAGEQFWTRDRRKHKGKKGPMRNFKPWTHAGIIPTKAIATRIANRVKRARVVEVAISRCW